MNNVNLFQNHSEDAGGGKMETRWSAIRGARVPVLWDPDSYVKDLEWGGGIGQM